MAEKAEKSLLTREDIEAILDVGRQRAAILYRLKQAILDGDSALEHAIAREVCGLPKETT